MAVCGPPLQGAPQDDGKTKLTGGDVEKGKVGKKAGDEASGLLNR